MMTAELNLTDVPTIPDLSAFAQEDSAPWEDGWYKGVILQERRFTDKNGNERVFESEDKPAQRSGRNIRLQIEITRKSDGRTLNISWLVNYNPTHLTAETITQVLARKAEADGQMGDLFPAFMTLQRLQKFQAVAGVRQLTSDSQGGLDLTPLYGKEAYFKVVPDERNDKYKTIKDVRANGNAPKLVL